MILWKINPPLNMQWVHGITSHSIFGGWEKLRLMSGAIFHVLIFDKETVLTFAHLILPEL